MVEIIRRTELITPVIRVYVNQLDVGFVCQFDVQNILFPSSADSDEISDLFSISDSCSW